MSTSGKSFYNQTVESTYALPSSSASGYYQRLSAFLTGRRYSGPNNWQDDKHESGQFGDDVLDNADINTPAAAASLFYVYDPTDNHDGTTDNSYPKPDRVNGYNDLEMRKQRLCQFLNHACNPDMNTKVLAIMSRTSVYPLPKKGH
ncbi:MAG TPA: hypothetical protein PL009_12955 [Flavipsychrobacter sp.]|nr:hypothetical protein [Flavipsychrobacter sp.]